MSALDGVRSAVGRAVFDTDVVRHAIEGFLPVAPRDGEPNLAAATCSALRARALWSDRDEESALAEARRAHAWCPEFVDALDLQVRILEALGRDTTAVVGQLRAYERARRELPWHGPALLTVGWIDRDTYVRVYESSRQRRVLDRLIALRGVVPGVSVVASVVETEPLASRGLVVGLNFLDRESWIRVSIDGFAFVPVADERLDALVAHVVAVLGRLTAAGLQTYTLVCGKGLCSAVDEIQATLLANGFTIIVYPSQTEIKESPSDRC
mmetsp:Transcript_3930/g.10082  ORF Transcript_3930/g.10082 Transcript_3930/m.10082 type:complete len:268 (-) Transcript_3930:286-1089(-)